MANADPEGTPSDARCHFFKIPLELRDKIYDYVACAEKNPGLHINLKVAREPVVHAYDHNLSQTCSQVRQDYDVRLQRRIKQMTLDHKASGLAWETMVLCRAFKYQAVLIAESKASKGVWNQDGVALRMMIAFRGMFDDGKPQSTLAFTVASGAVRDYNRRFIAKVHHPPGQAKTPSELASAVGCLSVLKEVTEPDARNWWTLLWIEFECHRKFYTESANAPLGSYSGSKIWMVSYPTSRLPAKKTVDSNSEAVTKTLRSRRRYGSYV